MINGISRFYCVCYDEIPGETKRSTNPTQLIPDLVIHVQHPMKYSFFCSYTAQKGIASA